MDFTPVYVAAWAATYLGRHDYTLTLNNPSLAYHLDYVLLYVSGILV